MPVRGRPHLGRRGSVLLFFGFLDLVYAFSLAAPDVESRRDAFFVWLAAIAEPWLWAAVWAGVGVVCLWQAFVPRDRVGYTAAYTITVWWGLVCAGGWVFGGVDRGYVSAAVWLGLAWVLWRISGWPEVGDWRGPTWTRPSSSPS